MGQMEMKCIFNIGKNISILAKVTQVSDMAHEPLVVYSFKHSVLYTFVKKKILLFIIFIGNCVDLHMKFSQVHSYLQYMYFLFMTKKKKERGEECT
jgi:hypothetical protein